MQRVKNSSLIRSEVKTSRNFSPLSRLVRDFRFRMFYVLVDIFRFSVVSEVCVYIRRIYRVQLRLLRFTSRAFKK